MNDYDFKQLNDKEFEVLSTDLLSRRENLTFERFKPGRDSGVDGRYYSVDGREIIVQCKHWVNSPIERLVRSLKKDEYPKIEKLNPKRYLLVISHALSRNDKSNIMEALKPYVKNPLDILGKEDLNDLLSKHPDVESRHYKLWISSSTVLRHLINKPILDRSDFALEEILDSSNLYVTTENHNNASEKLESLGTVIITGPAGIGKTTLADHLVLNYLADGYSLVRIANEIKEAEAVFEPSGKQIFYFDDFLGRNYLAALNGHEGSHIVQFIRRIMRDRTKRFVLTSRNTILNQGKILIDVFENHNIDKNEFEITLDSFTQLDRARILYNHIWHSGLGPSYIDAFYEDRHYRTIISHKNYNPRLVRYITDSDLIADVSPEDYWAHAKGLLSNPAKVWENPFQAQQDDFGRALVLLVTLNRKSITQSDLAEAYSRFVKHPDAVGMQGRHDYIINIKHLSGSLLSRQIDKYSVASLNLFNPSIGDFVLHRYSTDIPSLRAGFASLRSSDSIRTLHDLARNEIIDNETAAEIALHLIELAVEESFTGFTSEYVSVLCNCLLELEDSDKNMSLLRAATTYVVEETCPLQLADVTELFRWAYLQKFITVDNVLCFFAEAGKKSPYPHEIRRLVELRDVLDSTAQGQVLTMLQTATFEYYSTSIHSVVADDDIFSSLEPDDITAAEQRLVEVISNDIASLGIQLEESKILEIAEEYVIRERMEAYFMEENLDSNITPLQQSDNIDEIEDLFDRSGLDQVHEDIAD